MVLCHHAYRADFLLSEPANEFQVQSVETDDTGGHDSQVTGQPGELTALGGQFLPLLFRITRIEHPDHSHVAT